MHEVFYVILALAGIGLSAFLFHQYRVQKSALWRVLHLIFALSERQYARRTDPSGRGPAGDLARAANALAEDLESLTARAQQDSDHLLSLLAVLDHTNEIALATDAADHLRLANPAAARVLGRPVEQLLGKNFDEVVRHLELQALYRSAFHSAKPVSTHVTLETPLGSAASRRTLHCQATAATIYNGAHYRGTLLLLRDITEVARTLQIKTDFVANASHELRTPVASIRAAVETLQESAEDGLEELNPETTRRCVEIIQNHALRLEMIITDLLDLSRAEMPGAGVRSDTIDLSQIGEQAISLLTAKAQEKHLQLRLDLAPDAKTIKGDERLLLLALNNLLDNAIKFTTAGSVAIRSYRTREPLPVDHFPHLSGVPARADSPASQETDTVVVEVQDTGCGIPLEDQQRVFERFYTVNRSRGGATRGTGLGLAIVKHAVAAMGGRVSLLSAPGEGATLRCHFPQKSPAESKAPQVAEPAEA